MRHVAAGKGSVYNIAMVAVLSASEEVIRRVRRFLDLHAGPPPRRWLIALSGGMDSVVLTHVLCRLRGEEGLVLSAAHMDHGIRREAEEDALFAAAFCREMDIPCTVGRRDVPALAAEWGMSPEEAARAARYAFLEEVRQQTETDAIVLAHHMRDQAETLLLRLARGSSAEGMGGMRPAAGRRMRPLLDVPWELLRDYAAENGLSWREDSTNADASIPRNAMRHRVIPAVEDVFPGAQAGMARTARLLQRDDDCLRQLAQPLLAHMRMLPGGGGILPAAPLADAHPALAGRAVLMALRACGCEAYLTETHVDAIMRLTHGRTGAGVDIPGGWRAERDSRHVAFLPVGREEAGEEIPFPRVNAEIALGKRRVSVCFGRKDGLPGQVLDAACIPEDAVLRRRMPGDRMQPLGMTGTRKLKDILIDDKIPARERDGLVLLASGSRVLHILGTGRIDESVKVSRNTREYIAITIYDDERI